MKADLEFHRVIGRKIPPEPWTRPSDWLPLPEVSEGDQKFVGLYAVFPRTPAITNFMVCTPEYRVDWGDGSVDDVGDTSAVSHTYDYDALPAESYCSRGYKQVIITITPRLGKNLTKVLFTLSSTYRHFLDINMAGAYINELSGLSGQPMLERLNYPGQNLITSFLSTLQNNYRLKIIENLYLGKATTLNGIFRECGALEILPSLDTGACANFNNMFISCKNLETIPAINTALGTYFSDMFNGCNKLKEVPALDTTLSLGFSNFFRYCTNVTKILATGISKTIGISYLRLPADEIVRVFNNLASGVTGQTIDITGNPGTATLTAAERAIATDKGWTITG